MWARGHLALHSLRLHPLQRFLHHLKVGAILRVGTQAQRAQQRVRQGTRHRKRGELGVRDSLPRDGARVAHGPARDAGVVQRGGPTLGLAWVAVYQRLVVQLPENDSKGEHVSLFAEAALPRDFRRRVKRRASVNPGQVLPRLGKPHREAEVRDLGDKLHAGLVRCFEQQVGGL